MKKRRFLWVGLGMVIAGIVMAAALAVAGLKPADLTFTPKTEQDMTNIDVARAYAKNYYGAPTAIVGSGGAGTWATPLNEDSNYAGEARSVARDGRSFLRDKARPKKTQALVLDV